MAKLRITRWYEGGDDSAQISAHLPEITEFANAGGWPSREEFQRARLADIKKIEWPISVVKTEFGYRTDTPCRGALTGLTKVEVAEIIEDRAA